MRHPWPEVMLLDVCKHAMYAEVPQLFMVMMHQLQLQLPVGRNAETTIQMIQAMLIKCHTYWAGTVVGVLGVCSSHNIQELVIYAHL